MRECIKCAQLACASNWYHTSYVHMGIKDDSFWMCWRLLWTTSWLANIYYQRDSMVVVIVFFWQKFYHNRLKMFRPYFFSLICMNFSKSLKVIYIFLYIFQLFKSKVKSMFTLSRSSITVSSSFSHATSIFFINRNFWSIFFQKPFVWQISYHILIFILLSFRHFPKSVLCSSQKLLLVLFSSVFLIP